jgi:putative membrane protein
MGGTNAMFKYLKPSMRPWLLLAALALIALGVYGLIRGRHADDAEGDADASHDGHAHRLGIGWLLTVPVIVIILFGTEALGAYAAQQANGSLPPYSFNIAAYAQTQAGGPLDLKSSDIENGMRARANRAFLAGHDVRLSGFVTEVDKRGAGTFVLSHFLITCCAADAYPIQLGMVGARSIPVEGKWVEVVARYLPHAREPRDSPLAATLRVQSLKRIKAPDNPYESLR